VAYGTPGATSGAIKRIGGIAKALVILQIIVLAASGVLVLLQLAVANRANDYLDGQLSRKEFEDKLAPVIGFGLLAGLVAIAAVVLLIIWSFRIAGNLRSLGRDITWKPGLTIVVWLLGGCTLNIINFLTMREQWTASDPEVGYGDQRWKAAKVSPLIVAWFVLTLAQVVLSFSSGIRTVSGVNVGGSTRRYAEALSDRMPVLVLSSVASIASAAVFIVIIRQLSARHMSATHEA
jgi:hypothetical protein